ncbi:hypothetical protein LTR36_006737 [Oleoguttula mirabilis]|uniref:Fe2OG dioxygenase domain-containing protein n=1 Tax=Oleoguttula mirabilis TaxID=1507867 RepID=A0AAV9JBP8_9PEZI|nr:hypothetical protein LTR36_006737 [Oleoguttula mirabilis]
MTQTASTQLGASAIAHPQDGVGVLAPVPKLHHLEETPVQARTNGDDEGADELTFQDLPPFPDDVPTAPLLRLSLKKLLDRDPQEETSLWRACCDLGFFYLDLRSGEQSKRDSFHEDGDGELNGDALLKDADALFHLGEQLFSLPDAEKQKYDFKDQGSYFGYKGLGSGVLDSKGTRDRNEFYNTSKDDHLGLSERLPAPDLLQKDDSRALLKSYMQRSHAIVSLILGQLNSRLGLPSETLQSLHRLRGASGDQVRWVRSPPQPMDDRKLALGEHSDFGSVTILFNRLGGLQVLPPNSEEWCYVKPLRGHCIVNLGDAMVKFTAGILRSNIHRVVNPPGEQGGSTRMSLVYFARPEDEVVLKVLEGSEMIRDKHAAQQGGSADEEQITAKEWIMRRAMGRRAGGDWAKSAGTEGERLKQ